MGIDASQPQTDRELLLKLNGNVEVLAQAIDHFSKTLKEIDEKKLAGFENRLSSIEDWRLQIAGGWKIMVIVWTVFSAGGIAALIKYFLR